MPTTVVSVRYIPRGEIAEVNLAKYTPIEKLLYFFNVQRLNISERYHLRVASQCHVQAMMCEMNASMTSIFIRAHKLGCIMVPTSSSFLSSTFDSLSNLAKRKSLKVRSSLVERKIPSEFPVASSTKSMGTVEDRSKKKSPVDTQEAYVKVPRCAWAMPSERNGCLDAVVLGSFGHLDRNRAHAHR